ncbi:MAG: hypothetical protein K9M96_02410, partial [Deltaproteobacteria bacterium]|nr:hypothetical protein [Deltaproteobacteria bacterium]
MGEAFAETLSFAFHGSSQQYLPEKSGRKDGIKNRHEITTPAKVSLLFAFMNIHPTDYGQGGDSHISIE